MKEFEIRTVRLPRSLESEVELSFSDGRLALPAGTHVIQYQRMNSHFYVYAKKLGSDAVLFRDGTAYRVVEISNLPAFESALSEYVDSLGK